MRPIVRHNNIQLLVLLMVSAVIAAIPFYNIQGTVSTILGLLILGVVLLSPLYFGVLCVAYAIPFALGTAGVFGDYNLNLGLQAIVIVKALALPNKMFDIEKISEISLACVVVQVGSLILFDQSFKNVFQLVVNVSLLFLFYSVIRSNIVTYKQVLLVFSLGVLVSCFVADNGMFEVIDAENKDAAFYRFSGLWIDPNFMGFFCNFVVATILVCSENNPRRLLLLSPPIFIAIHYGFKTLSFTYVLILGLLIVFYLLSYRNNGKAMLLFVLLAIAIAPILFSRIDALLEVRVVGDDSDFSHGRLTSTREILQVFFSRFDTVLFGIGYGNLLHAYDCIGFSRDLGSHNSYVDLLVEFGLLANMLLLGWLVSIKGVVRKYVKPLFVLQGLPVLVLLVYMSSISGLKYDFFFIILGSYLANVHNNEDNKAIVRSGSCQIY